MSCLSQVNEAEEERLRSEREHMRVTHACQEAEARVQMLQKSLKRAIVKSKPYFELKAQFNQILEVKLKRFPARGCWGGGTLCDLPRLG